MKSPCLFLLRFLFIFGWLIPCQAHAQTVAQGTVLPTRQTPMHDPVLIKEANTFYLFATGEGIAVWSSTDLQNWKREAPVFTTPAAWGVAAIPTFKGHIWAPHILYHNGAYYLYYAVSAFGKNTSCIGVAVTKTLNPKSPDFKWEDKGMVLQSIPGRDSWNAIDPAVIIDETNTPWLAFGSFWEGIKLTKLNPDLLSLSQPQQWHTLARRQRSFAVADSAAGDAAIEAPFIFAKSGYYYLFVSWDYCCRAEKSTYKVVVGRSKNIIGPYMDEAGIAMTQGGGTLLVEGDSTHWFGAGHNAVYTIGGRDYIVYHGYDAADKGRAKLQLQPLHWDASGWPVLLNRK